ncbi:MAG: peptide chain release factor N(5)-glutamine methyltransferase [Christensenellaceae bacterium]|jgi:release factor glutamine methyltransferase|nr:peptide chain release factor N(5)-glutamine methyltransferase [Christensenellaceae bacterium]
MSEPQTVLDCLRFGEGLLRPSPDAKTDARLLAEAFLGAAGVQNLRDEPPKDAKTRYFAALARRKAGEPAQYILNKAWFMGLALYVDERVLIPRQDSETLCEAALRLAKERGYLAALDLCTGSGAIALALAAHSTLAVSAADLSPGALEVAARNAKELGLSIALFQGDLFQAVKGRRFDLIACNPPYLSQSDLAALQPELRWEPTLALDGGRDGLDFYRRLAAEAGGFVNEGGALLMEVGFTQAGSVKALFAQKTEVLLDLNGIRRVVCAYY